jgi:hypothetical protein
LCLGDAVDDVEGWLKGLDHRVTFQRRTREDKTQKRRLFGDA